MSQAAENRNAPSKDQVRVWLATVLAPVGRCLDLEVDLAASRSWSFRCWSRDFEFLVPTDRMVSPAHLPNLRQFWRFHGRTAQMAEAHDAVLARQASEAVARQWPLVTANVRDFERVPGLRLVAV